jgi:hypothetical protein
MLMTEWLQPLPRRACTGSPRNCQDRAQEGGATAACCLPERGGHADDPDAGSKRRPHATAMPAQHPLTTTPPPCRPAPRDLCRLRRRRGPRRSSARLGSHRRSQALAARRRHGRCARPGSRIPRDATVHHAALSFQRTFRERTRSPDRGSDRTRHQPLSPWNTFAAPSPASQIGPRTDSAQRTTRPTEMSDADRRTSGGRTDRRQTTQTHHRIRAPRPQTTAASSRYRAWKPKAPRPASTPPWPTGDGHPPTTRRTATSLLRSPRSSSRRSTPQESHEARAHDGAARRASRNLPSSQHRRVSGPSPSRSTHRARPGLRVPRRPEARALRRSLSVDTDP